MRIVEVTSGNDGPYNLLTVLNFLKNRYEEKNLKPVVSTRSLINMVRNTGLRDFNYETLVAFNEDPKIKGLISSLNKDTVELISDLDSDSIQNTDIQNTPDSPANTVQKMAKRAMNKRS